MSLRPGPEPRRANNPARQCGTKRTYLTKADAKRAARRAETAMAAGHLEVYRCPHCSRWHVGHAR